MYGLRVLRLRVYGLYFYRARVFWDWGLWFRVFSFRVYGLRVDGLVLLKLCFLPSFLSRHGNMFLLILTIFFVWSEHCFYPHDIFFDPHAFYHHVSRGALLQKHQQTHFGTEVLWLSVFGVGSCQLPTRSQLGFFSGPLSHHMSFTSSIAWYSYHVTILNYDPNKNLGCIWMYHRIISYFKTTKQLSCFRMTSSPWL